MSGVITLLLLVIAIVAVFGEGGKAFIKYALVFLFFLIIFAN
jgi:hypothetical protein